MCHPTDWEIKRCTAVHSNLCVKWTLKSLCITTLKMNSLESRPHLQASKQVRHRPLQAHGQAHTQGQRGYGWQAASGQQPHSCPTHVRHQTHWLSLGPDGVAATLAAVVANPRPHHLLGLRHFQSKKIQKRCVIQNLWRCVCESFSSFLFFQYTFFTVNFVQTNVDLRNRREKRCSL